MVNGILRRVARSSGRCAGVRCRRRCCAITSGEDPWALPPGRGRRLRLGALLAALAGRARCRRAHAYAGNCIRRLCFESAQLARRTDKPSDSPERPCDHRDVLLLQPESVVEVGCVVATTSTTCTPSHHPFASGGVDISPEQLDLLGARHPDLRAYAQVADMTGSVSHVDPSRRRFHERGPDAHRNQRRPLAAGHPQHVPSRAPADRSRRALDQARVRPELPIAAPGEDIPGTRCICNGAPVPVATIRACSSPRRRNFRSSRFRHRAKLMR